MPTVTIITVTHNAAETIHSCLESVAAQNVDVEHIIVDGASSDDTLNIVHHFKSNKGNRVIISEPDNGIYDAMNKGLRLAKGDIIGILNADDFYATDHILSRVVRSFCDTQIESCYGDLLYVDRNHLEKITRYWRAGKFHKSDFYLGWMPPHPTFFVRRHVYENFGLFNTKLGSAADYEMMLRLLFRHGITVDYIPEVLIKMRNGGVSNMSIKNRLHANLMDREAWRVNHLQPRPWTLWAKPIRKITQFVLQPSA